MTTNNGTDTSNAAAATTAVGDGTTSLGGQLPSMTSAGFAFDPRLFAPGLPIPTVSGEAANTNANPSNNNNDEDDGVAGMSITTPSDQMDAMAPPEPKRPRVVSQGGQGPNNILSSGGGIRHGLTGNAVDISQANNSAATSITSTSASASAPAKGRNVPMNNNTMFPKQLMEMLSNDAHSHIVAWTEAGDGFTVHDKELFVSEVMPLYFGKRSKFTSFTRKLNRWGFARASNGNDKGSYTHPLFNRNDPDACNRMACASGASGASRGSGGRGGGKKRGSSALKQIGANDASKVDAATDPGAGATTGLPGFPGTMGLMTPHMVQPQLTAQMLLAQQGGNQQGLTPGGLLEGIGLSPFGATGLSPMALTPGSFTGLTPGGFSGMSPGIFGMSPMFQLNSASFQQTKSKGGGDSDGLSELASGSAPIGLPPPPPLAGASSSNDDKPASDTDNVPEGNIIKGDDDGNGALPAPSQGANVFEKDTHTETTQQKMAPLALNPNNPFSIGSYPAILSNPFLSRGLDATAGAQFLQQQMHLQQMQQLQFLQQQVTNNKVSSSSLSNFNGEVDASGIGSNGQGKEGDGAINASLPTVAEPEPLLEVNKVAFSQTSSAPAGDNTHQLQLPIEAAQSLSNGGFTNNVQIRFQQLQQQQQQNHQQQQESV